LGGVAQGPARGGTQGWVRGGGRSEKKGHPKPQLLNFLPVRGPERLARRNFVARISCGPRPAAFAF